MMLGEAPTVLQRRVSFCISISTRVVADATLKQSHQQLVINGEVTLYVGVYYPPTLQHLRSPRSTGCLLRGGLTLTAIGLPPASRRQLSGHTSAWLAALCVATCIRAFRKQAMMDKGLS